MDDLISRQAAIDAADMADYPGLSIEDVDKVTGEVVKALKELPSAQSEIIYCKDCTRYEKKNGRCNLVEGLNVATANSFCSYGERKE